MPTKHPGPPPKLKAYPKEVGAPPELSVPAPPTEDKPLEDAGWDIANTLGVGAAGALAGFGVGGVPGAVAGGGIAMTSDIAAQIVGNLASGLPAWVGLPLEIAAAIKAGKWAGKIFPSGRKTVEQATKRASTVDDVSALPRPTLRPKPPQTEEPVPTKPPFFQPREEYSPGATTVSSTKGQWPNITNELKWGTPPAKPSSTVTGQWPNILSRSEHGPATPPAARWSQWQKILNQTKTAPETAPPTALKAQPGSKAGVASAAPDRVPPSPTAGGGDGQSVWDDVSTRGQDAFRLTVEPFFSPVLSAIERAAGPVVGKNLAALEGKQFWLQQQYWTQLFDKLEKSLHKLPVSLYDNFVDTVEGKAKPANALVAQKVVEWNQVWGPQGAAVKAMQKGGLDIDPVANYFPHEFEPSWVRGLYNNPERVSAIAKQMVKDGVAIDTKHAQRMIHSYMAKPSRSLYQDRPIGSEFDRTGVEGYIKDPLQVTATRGRAIARRLSQLEVYGPKNVNVHKEISKLPRELGTRVEHLFKLTLGRDPVDEGLSKIAQGFMSFNAITSLSLSGIMNLSQPGLGVLRTTLPTMARAIFSTIKNPYVAQETARQLGVYADMAQRALMQELTGGLGNTMARGSLKFFNLTERFVRSIAAQAGIDWARQIEERLKTVKPGKQLEILKRELVNLNFTPEELNRVLQTRTLTDRDTSLIAFSIADQVSFIPRPARKSKFFLENPIGPVILQFKGFLMNAGRLLKNTVFDEYRAGNKEPLRRLVTTVLPTLAIGGEITADLNATARGSMRDPVDITSPTSLAMRAFDNITQVGVMGLGLEMLREMTGLKAIGTGDLTKFLMGPTVTMFAEEGKRPFKAATAFAKGDDPEGNRQVYELGRRVARRVPYLGPWIANQTLPSTNRTWQQESYDWRERLGFGNNPSMDKQMREFENKMRHLKQQQGR